MSAEVDAWLAELRAAQERLRRETPVDAVTQKLCAMDRDIAAAQAELDALIASARERARRLDELDARAGPPPA